MDSKYPSAPELPGKHSGQYDTEPEEANVPEPEQAEPAQPKLQLLNSTKPAEPEPEEALADDEDDELNEHVTDPGDPDGVVADEKIKEWQKSHPLPVTDTKRKRRWPKVLLVLVVLAVIAAVVFRLNSKPAKAPATNVQTTSSTKNQQAATNSEATTTAHYDSTTYTLSFDYPQTWKVSDTTTKLTVTSPEVSLTGADGKSTKAHVVVSMQNQQTTITGYPSGGAFASLASDKLSYKQPTQIQRAQTYVSYLGYADQSNLDAIYVTGDNGYTQGQTVPMSDVVKGNPLISVSFLNCSTIDCSNGGSALKLQASAWKSGQASKDVTALIESLQLN